MSYTTPDTTPAPPVRPALAGFTLIPAATLVVFRHDPAGGAPQLLMVQRAREMRFAGGAAVFPGGRVDPEDHTLAARIAAQTTGQIATQSPAIALDDLVHRIAAIRETLEEAGLAVGFARPVSADEAAKARAMLLEVGALAPVLDAFGWELAPGALTPFAHWCPPKDGAFDTRFYMADIGTGALDLAVDATEHTRLFWISAQSALDAANAGEISVIFPTRRNLERLAQFDSFGAAQAHALTTPMPCITPQVVAREGEKWLMIPEGLGYPVLGENVKTALRG